LINRCPRGRSIAVLCTWEDAAHQGEALVRTLLYDNFDVLIEGGGDTFRAMVVNSPDGETRTVPFVPPVSPERLELLVLKMRTAPGMRAMQTDAAPDTRQLGATLFDALFHDDVLDRLRRSLSRTEARGRGLRIRLRFSDAHELWNMPWELLYDTEERRFLCQFDTTPVVRYVDMAQPVEPLTVSGPIRMLVMISSPTDYPPLDVDKEWAQLSEALHPLEAAGGLLVQRLPSASLEDLRRTMMFGEFHVFHYIGHGGLDQHTGDGLLVLTGPDGRSRLATGAELYVMLANSPVRLAVLNSCQGARIGAADPYAGAAASLVHQGIPAVVAMQFEISDDAAIAFSRTLYEAIAYGWPVDTAVAEARRAILAASRAEWATPVLYLRAADGVLLNTPAPSRTPAPAQPTGLTGSVTDGVVTLQWAPTSAGLTEVARWEVRRDGTAVSEATEPHATDQPTQPGSHQYTVLAIGTDGQHSTESAPWTAVLPSTPKAPPDRAGEPEPPGQRPRRWRLALAGAAIVVVGIAAGIAGATLFSDGDETATPPSSTTSSNEATSAATPPCSPVDGSWQQIDVPQGALTQTEEGQMVVTVTKGWYVQQGDQWLVRLETETQNISQEAHYHGDYYYRTVVLDGLPQGEKTCFSLTGGEILVAPFQHNVSEVEFELDGDPAGKPLFLELNDSKTIQVTPSV
jgi:CHAT domain